MKKGVLICCFCFCVVIIIGYVFLTHKSDPVDIARDYVEELFIGIECDLTGLKYTITQESDYAAKIKISGKIAYEDELTLVKEDGKWVITTKEISFDTPETGLEQEQEAHESEKPTHKVKPAEEKIEAEHSEKTHSSDSHH